MTRNVSLSIVLLICLAFISGCGDDSPTGFHDTDIAGSWLRTYVNSSPSTDGTVLTFNADGNGTILDDSYHAGESDPLTWKTNEASTTLTLIYTEDDDNYTVTYNYTLYETTLTLSSSNDIGDEFTQTFEKQ